MNISNVKVPRRIAKTILNALKGGVVPRIGLPYIVVGRKDEIATLLHDVDSVSEGGASFRFIVGRYGSGKSFLIQTIRNNVINRDFIVADADLSPERHLRGTKGQGLATYRELINNLSTKTKPEGGALPLILDRWINNIQSHCVKESGYSLEDPKLTNLVEKKIFEVINYIQELVHGFEFAKLLLKYYRAYMEEDNDTKTNVIRWFKGEYLLKSDVKKELGINILITDDNWYDYLKVFAKFFRLAGYKGIMVMIDELVNLYNIPHSVSRQYNYEKLLAMYNDVLQGKAQHIGIIMGCTPQAMEDRNRGIYSYEALHSRLAESKFLKQDERNLLAPVIRLEALTPEDMIILCEKLVDIHSDFYGYESNIINDDITNFIIVEYERIGAEQNITPREVIRDFIGLLDLIYQNPDKNISYWLNSDEFSFVESQAVSDNSDDDYIEFEI